MTSLVDPSARTESVARLTILRSIRIALPHHPDALRPHRLHFAASAIRDVRAAHEIRAVSEGAAQRFRYGTLAHRGRVGSNAHSVRASRLCRPAGCLDAPRAPARTCGPAHDDADQAGHPGRPHEYARALRSSEASSSIVPMITLPSVTSTMIIDMRIWPSRSRQERARTRVIMSVSGWSWSRVPKAGRFGWEQPHLIGAWGSAI